MSSKEPRAFIPLFKVRMSPNAAERVKGVLESGYIGQGEQVEIFERALAQFTGHPAPLSLNSATSGLMLALRLIRGIDSEPGEVLAPPITCTATNWPILASGQKIRWVDTNHADGNMDVEDLRSKLSPRTRAIMLVHWGGYPNDLDAIKAVQDECYDKYGTRPSIVEDAAHAFGSKYRGNMIGTSGNYCVFSFQAIKHLTCGDGGALLCPDEHETERARLMRWYGMDRAQSNGFRFLTQMCARFSPQQVSHAVERGCGCVRARESAVKSSIAQSTAACAGPAFGGGPARRQPVPPQGAEALAFTGRRTMNTRGTRPGLSPTFYRWAEPSLTVQPLGTGRPLANSAVYRGPDFPRACSSSPDTDGVLQPRKSMTMLDLLAMEPAKAAPIPERKQWFSMRSGYRRMGI